MTQEFEHSLWADRLAAALKALAPKVTPRVRFDEVDNSGNVREYTRVVSYEEYRDLANMAQHDPGAQAVFVESHVWSNDDPSDVKAVLCEHPVISKAVGQSANDPVIQFIKPYGASRVELETLAFNLTRLTIRSNERSAAPVSDARGGPGSGGLRGNPILRTQAGPSLRHRVRSILIHLRRRQHLR